MAYSNASALELIRASLAFPRSWGSEVPRVRVPTFRFFVLRSSFLVLRSLAPLRGPQFGAARARVSLQLVGLRRDRLLRQHLDPRVVCLRQRTQRVLDDP